MKLKTSNKLLLGYLASLLLIIGGTIIFGFAPADSLEFQSNMPAVQQRSEPIESFSVLHISGNNYVGITQGTAFEIEYSEYPGHEASLNLSVRVANDTCFVDKWERVDLTSAVLKVPAVRSIVVSGGAELGISKFTQEELQITLDAGRANFGEMNTEIGTLNVTARNGSKLSIFDVDHLVLDLDGSRVSVYDYVEQISGKLQNNSKLEAHESAGKVDIEKSKNSKLGIY